MGFPHLSLSWKKSLQLVWLLTSSNLGSCAIQQGKKCVQQPCEIDQSCEFNNVSCEVSAESVGIILYVIFFVNLLNLQKIWQIARKK